MYSDIWSPVMGIRLEFLGGRVLLQEEFHWVGNLKFYSLAQFLFILFLLPVMDER